MLQALERRFASFYLQSGGMLMMFFRALSEFSVAPRERQRLLEQMKQVGWDTVPLALLVGAFTGMTVALGVGLVAEEWGQTRVIASVVAESIIKEMGPVFTAFIISARVGAAMTAELATMSVNEEINVLRVTGIRIYRYLAMPRVIAAVLMTPALTAYAILVGLIGGFIVSNTYFDVSWLVYKTETFRYISMDELYKGLIKSTVFGAIYSSVCVYKGMNTEGGAEEVGQSTTSAVVISLAGVLIANYLMSRFLYG